MHYGLWIAKNSFLEKVNFKDVVKLTITGSDQRNGTFYEWWSKHYWRKDQRCLSLLTKFLKEEAKKQNNNEKNRREIQTLKCKLKYMEVIKGTYIRRRRKVRKQSEKVFGWKRKYLEKSIKKLTERKKIIPKIKQNLLKGSVKIENGKNTL